MVNRFTGRLRRFAAIGIAGGAALMLAACAGGSGGSGGNGGGGGEDGPATIKLSIGPVFYEVVRIAEQEGLFEKQNLDVEIVEGATASENAAQLIAGQVDIAMSGGVSIVQGASEGLGIRTILGATSSDPEVWTSGIVAKADSGIEDYGDLAGKTIAMAGLNSNTHLNTLLAIDSAGIDIDDVTIVDLPLPNLNDAVANGDVDAAYTIGAFWGAGIEAGLVEVGTPSSDVAAWTPSVIYAATDEWVDANEDTVKRFQDAIIEAAEMAREDNFAMVREVQLEYSQLPPDYIKTATLAGYQTDLYRQGFQTILDGMFKFGWIEEELTIEDVVSPLAPLVDAP